VSTKGRIVIAGSVAQRPGCGGHTWVFLQYLLGDRRDFSIDVGGKTFRAATPNVEIHSDPGTLTYRTLEVTWKENGVEMRVNIYFAGDAQASWAEEIRISDATKRDAAEE